MRTMIALLALAAVPTLAEDDRNYGTTYRIKVDIGSESRKAALFIPKGLKKNQALPVLVTVPETGGKAFLELGQWLQFAYEERFAVFSIDITTNSKKGWHASEQIEMQNDMEAVAKGLEAAFAKAKEAEVTLDRSAVVITGHSGGSYLALWMGLRRPDVFMGICGRGCVFFKETIKFGKLDTVKPDFNMPIFLYRGELDNPRVSKETDVAKRTLEEAGFKRIAYKVVPKMTHESKPEVCRDWFVDLLKETAKPRAEAQKIAVELVKVREGLEKKRAGSIGKLARLAEREKKAGFAAGALELLGEYTKRADADMAAAARMVEAGEFDAAVAALKTIEKTYNGLETAKLARKTRSRILKSDAYKAAELLDKAIAYREKGLDEKALDILEKLADKYPETAAGAEAQRLLKAQ